MSGKKRYGNLRNHLRQPYHTQPKDIFGKEIHMPAYNHRLHQRGHGHKKTVSQKIPEIAVTNRPKSVTGIKQTKHPFEFKKRLQSYGN